MSPALLDFGPRRKLCLVVICQVRTVHLITCYNDANCNCLDVWSGGLAFSYFPAASAQGQFGIVNISADGSTVTPNADYDSLQGQYSLISSGPNTPSKSAAGSTSYPPCPQQNATFIASTTLPPTPNESACDCLESTLGCQFTPEIPNYVDVVGELIDSACGLLGQAGLNCNDIGGNGSTGVYGRVSGCDPSTCFNFHVAMFMT